MALERLRRKENVAGEFYVDETCIDCDLCRQIAPHTFGQAGEMSAVYHQPNTESEVHEALKALITCPTASIGSAAHRSAKEAVAAYPERIDKDVYFCGFAAESSYGASSYFIVRPEGNVLIDSPRFARPLVKRIEAMGGVRTMFLTHRDDVADHDLWANAFHAERVMHDADAGRLRTRIERLLSGTDPVQLDKDLLAIPTPGHTRGHMVLLFENRYLFTGDHLWWSDNFHSLNASHSVCWYSWPEQIRSVQKLLSYSFEWVLPGHGRRAHADTNQMHAYLKECLERVKQPHGAEMEV